MKNPTASKNPAKQPGSKYPEHLVENAALAEAASPKRYEAEHEHGEHLTSDYNRDEADFANRVARSAAKSALPRK